MEKCGCYIETEVAIQANVSGSGLGSGQFWVMQLNTVLLQNMINESNSGHSGSV